MDERTCDSVDTEYEERKGVGVNKHLLLQTSSVGFVGGKLGKKGDDSNSYMSVPHHVRSVEDLPSAKT